MSAGVLGDIMKPIKVAARGTEMYSLPTFLFARQARDHSWVCQLCGSGV